MVIINFKKSISWIHFILSHKLIFLSILKSLVLRNKYFSFVFIVFFKKENKLYLKL